METSFEKRNVNCSEYLVMAADVSKDKLNWYTEEPSDRGRVLVREGLTEQIVREEASNMLPGAAVRRQKV